MITTSTRRLRVFLVVGALAVALGLGTGSPELVAIGAPFLVLVGVGSLTEQAPELAVSTALSRRRALEGERVTLDLTVGAARPLQRIDVLIPLPHGIELIDAGLDGEPAVIDNGVVVTSLPAGSSSIEIGLRCVHWGTYRFDRVELRSRSLIGTHAHSIRAGAVLQLKVFPAVAVLRRLLEPMETRLGFGDLVSRARGAGFEYADLRAYVPGDDPRSINWRVTARAGEPWITERHPERSADVVLMLDTFAEARRGVDQTLDLAVRAVTSLIEAHGRRLDRVGLLAFGEPVRWLQPGMGDRHRYRVLDTLMESRLVWQQYWRGLGAVPRRSLPANALIIALSPLLDDRAVRALADVRGRGFDLAIIELELHDFLPAPRDDIDAIARRIWSLERDHIRHRFERQGVVVTPWIVGDPFPNAILQADSFRRRLLRARV